MIYDTLETPMIADRLEISLSKIDFIASFLSDYKEGNILNSEGMYYILRDTVEEIRELFEFTKETPLPEPKPQLFKRAA
ncbi:hypothetical protein [Sulfuricurvum sp.]|uniref:hypothetical protein n=1 Tax=Sulfuricurvum sp. TaxID=2025608 RepID=UPI002614CB16|nr:hypothetical protein [Sulfuricurvum sp.]MDD2267453.1 hypothetical protein [Sulfuricurvum sp.]MDD2782825.1 hypothetical protein [Sulfuricurvum sp.]